MLTDELGGNEKPTTLCVGFQLISCFCYVCTSSTERVTLSTLTATGIDW